MDFRSKQQWATEFGILMVLQMDEMTGSYHMFQSKQYLRALFPRMTYFSHRN